MNHADANLERSIHHVELAQQYLQEYCAALIESLSTGGAIKLGPETTKEIDLDALKAVQRMRPIVIPRRDPILNAKEYRGRTLSIIDEYREDVLRLMQTRTFVRKYPALFVKTIKRIREDKAAKYPILSFSNQMLAICLEEVFSL